MASTDKVFRGLQILIPKFKDPTGYHLGAEHDEFYVWATDDPLTPEEVAELRELGWLQRDVRDASVYDSEQGWMVFL